MNDARHEAIGVVAEVHGPVVVVDCERLPRQREALRSHVDGETCYYEVHQHLDERRARAIALHDTAGLRRGDPVFTTGGPLRIPVGAECLGRALDAFGKPLNARPPPQTTVSRPIHGTPAALRDVSPLTGLLPTGIKHPLNTDQRERLAAGTGARVLAESLSIPAGPALPGRVVDPLGTPLDGEPPPNPAERQPLQRRSPPMAARDFTHAPLETGTTITDTLLPIGRGQRQLIIGDAGLGRSALAVAAVINQRGRDVRCVQVLIGQKRSTVVDTVETLLSTGALDCTTVVAAEASAPAGLRYLAPMAGRALAEYWTHRGSHALVVYDDLSTHALTYRERAASSPVPFATNTPGSWPSTTASSRISMPTLSRT